MSKSDFWIDEAGIKIPYNRTTKLERTKERLIHKLYTQSVKANEQLLKLKAEIEDITEEIVQQARELNEVKLNGKGNFTFFNFDRSLKVEVSVNELIRFDDVMLESAKEIIFEVVRSLSTDDGFIQSVAEDAFQTSRGRLDTRKVLGLRKHGERIKDKEKREQYEKAMKLIDKSITRPDSRTYYRVWFRDESGEYQNVELNFSKL